MYDPNGIQVEITIRTPDHATIMAHEKASLPALLRAWTDRTRPLKEAKFGSDALAKREAPAAL
jgi:hypothetical protein